MNITIPRLRKGLAEANPYEVIDELIASCINTQSYCRMDEEYLFDEYRIHINCSGTPCDSCIFNKANINVLYNASKQNKLRKVLNSNI